MIAPVTLQIGEVLPPKKTSSIKLMGERVAELVCTPLQHPFYVRGLEKLAKVLEFSVIKKADYCKELKQVMSENLPSKCIAGRVSVAYKAFQEGVNEGARLLNDFLNIPGNGASLIKNGLAAYDVSTEEWNPLLKDIETSTLEYLSSLELDANALQLTCAVANLALYANQTLMTAIE